MSAGESKSLVLSVNCVCVIAMKKILTHILKDKFASGTSVGVGGSMLAALAGLSVRFGFDWDALAWG